MVGQPRPCQAGRYLPEYVEYTKDKEFFSRCQNPEVACMLGFQGDTPQAWIPPGNGRLAVARGTLSHGRRLLGYWGGGLISRATPSGPGVTHR